MYKVAASVEEKREKTKQARTFGFTGDVCAECGGFNMKRAGACLVCTDCGSNTGCG